MLTLRLTHALLTVRLTRAILADCMGSDTVPLNRSTIIDLANCDLVEGSVIINYQSWTGPDKLTTPDLEVRDIADIADIVDIAGIRDLANIAIVASLIIEIIKWLEGSSLGSAVEGVTDQ